MIKKSGKFVKCKLDWIRTSLCPLNLKILNFVTFFIIIPINIDGVAFKFKMILQRFQTLELKKNCSKIIGSK